MYRFGPFYLDPTERVLTKGGTSIQLTPKAFDVLLLLVKEHGQLISKARLIDTIWPDAFVEEKTLTQNIFTLRKVLAPDAEGQHYIETVPKHGYRFKAEVEIISRRDYREGIEKEALPKPADTVQLSTTGSDAATRGELIDDKAVVGRQPATPMPQSSAAHAAPRREPLVEAPPIHHSSNLRLVTLFSIAAVVIIFSYLAGRFFFQRTGRLAESAFQKVSITRLTNGGDISALALASDGKYVAYSEIRGDTQSLFIRQIENTSAVEIVPPAPVSYRGITFSRDGAWIYYVTVEKNSFVGTLYRVPQLGGTPQKFLEESVGSRVEFSPDGKQVAFVHWTDRLHTALKVANVDGSGERQLALLDYQDGFSVDGPAWSPDGKTILAPTHSYNGAQPYASIVAVNVEDGKAQTLLGGRWNWIGQVTWLSDGSGVILSAWNSDSEVISDQIWLVSYPGGETRRLTNDVNGYLGVSVSADAKVIAVSESTPSKNFWVAPDGDWTKARKITNGSGELYSERFGMAWMTDGRIVYAARQSGNPDIWSMEADGTRQKQLTFDKGADLQPVVSADGRYIVFVSSRTGKNQLWRMDADGGHPLQLTNTEDVQSPSITLDSQWVVYGGDAQGKFCIWRVPIGGGDPIRLTTETAFLPAVSPDGEVIACLLPNEAPGPAKLTLISFRDGHVIKQFETLVRTPVLRWSPDGRSITYVVTREGVSNIWSQPIDGGAPKALTDWKDDLIYRFDWFRDGRLLCERGTTMADVILIRDAESK